MYSLLFSPLPPLNPRNGVYAGRINDERDVMLCPGFAIWLILSFSCQVTLFYGAPIGSKRFRTLFNMAF